MSTPNTPLQSDRQSFPGLMPNEVLVLKRWLKLHESEYDRFEYNVRIGPGFDPGEKHMDEIRAMSIANTQRRIDAIAWKGQQATIIEVKQRASFAAVGQLFGYETHWLSEHPGSGTPRLLLVAESTAEGTDLVIKRAGITLELV
jgi:hypothetical protein